MEIKERFFIRVCRKCGGTQTNETQRLPNEQKMNLSNSGLEGYSFNFRYRTRGNRLQRKKNPVQYGSFIGRVHCLLLLQLPLSSSVLFPMNLSPFFHSQHNTQYSPLRYIHSNTSSKILTIIFTVQHPVQSSPPHLYFTSS